MRYQHAVVIGGSVAGMCAAKAIAPFFERVTVVDRDEYPDRVEGRVGVPHARHIHGMLARGRQEIEQLFPGFNARVVARGAHEIDFGYDFAILRSFGWHPRTVSNVRGLVASRNLVEFTMRELLREAPTITLLSRADVVGLKLASDSPFQVAGVTLRARDGGAELPRELSAELVVDASGRSTHAPEWLRAVGAPLPEEKVVDSFSGYSSRWYKAPPRERLPASWWWKGIWVDPNPPERMFGGALHPNEDGRWVATLFGFAKQYPPTDEAGFHEAFRALPCPVIAEALSMAEPISPIYANRTHANRFRRYERLASPIGGFVAVGDGVCAFNPVYGQGMTAAVLGGTTLGATLQNASGRLGTDFVKRFFREQSKVLELVWGFATAADFAIPGTIGEAPPGLPIFKKYFDVLGEVSLTDQETIRQLMAVMHFVAPASKLFAPAIVGRVAKRAVERMLTRGTPRAAVPAMPPGVA